MPPARHPFPSLARLTIAALVMSLVALVSPATPPATAAELGWIEGTVTSDVDGSALAGVTVTLYAPTTYGDRTYWETVD